MAARWLDSGVLLAGTYLAAGLTCLVVGGMERRTRPVDRSWPTFWVVCGAVLGAVGVARAGKLEAVITGAGRARARADGWYAGRHHLQVDVIALIAICWASVVAVAVWKTRPSRRHCLPVAIAVLSLLSFLVVRLVSLHQVDRILSHRVHGVRAGSLIELAGTTLVIVLAVITAATTAMAARSGQRSAPASTTTTERRAHAQ
jgi:hypothetical protein